MFSTFGARGLVSALVLVGLGLGRQAHAERSVDWSQYLEPAGPRTPAKQDEATGRQPDKAASTKKQAPRGKAAKQHGAESRSKVKRPSPRSGRH